MHIKTALDNISIFCYDIFVILAVVYHFVQILFFSHYSLYEVSVECAQEKYFVKQKRLPEQMSNLPDNIGLNSRLKKYPNKIFIYYFLQLQINHLDYE